MIPLDRLYIATLAADAEALAAAHGLGLELDEFCTAANMDPEHFAQWDAEARRKLAATPRVIFHAPFAELSPAAVDPMIRQVVMARLNQAFQIAQDYGIRRMVVHAGYIPHVYFPQWFVQQSAAFWQAYLADKPGDFQLLLENVLEDDPAMLRALLEAIGDPRARLCLDVGHASLQPGHSLHEWIDMLGPSIAHVHLHNNDGRRDLHAPLREGTIPYSQIIGALLDKAPDATFTLEMDQAEASLGWLLGTPADTGDDMSRVLKQVFGYDAFREGQRELIQAQLAGRDALGVMPTGSGKSICFQLPALLLEGITLVVSPLISLMKDQVSALNQSGVRAAYLNSTLTERQMDSALRNAEAGEYKLIYIAPERLLTNRFLAFAQRADIALVAVDEAHCISQWGQDFRPNYLDIPAFVQSLGRRPVVSAFTATATPKVKADILRLLDLRDPAQVQTGFDRPNLYYEVLHPKKKNDALLALVHKHRGESGIIYCATRKNVEEVCALLLAQGVAATRYHAGLSDAERRENQEAFTFDRAPVIVATNAFGMGIDKSNVRFIIHYNMPKDLESYYQEAGRAGRDGEDAVCTLLYSGQDVSIQRFLIEKEDETEALDPRLRQETRTHALRRLEDMTRYCKTQKCLRAHILRYFGETLPEACGNCGSCASQAEARDETELSLKILRCVSDTGQRFGLGTILDTLRGANTKRIRQFGLNAHPAYGSLSGVPADRLKAVGDQLIAEDYLATPRDNKLPIIRLGPRACEAMHGGTPILLRLPSRDSASPPTPRPAPAAATADGPASAPASDGLFEVLRALRLRLAMQRGVPAYTIFTDAALLDMSAKRPQTRAEMLQVKGVGDAKLQQFGTVFLEEIARYAQRQG